MSTIVLSCPHTVSFQTSLTSYSLSAPSSIVAEPQGEGDADIPLWLSIPLTCVLHTFLQLEVSALHKETSLGEV